MSVVQLAPGMEYIVGGDGHQVLAGDGFQLGQTVVLRHQNVLEQVADAAGIAEAGVGALFSDVVADQGLGLRREDVALAAAHFEDLEHLLRGVVLEQQETVEAALQTGVGVDELIHQVGVARHDHHQIVPVILHGLEDGVNSLLTEVVVAAAVEGVSPT